MKEKIIITFYPGCVSFEVALVAFLLSQKYEIINATPDGQDLTEVYGSPLKAQISYADISLEDCRAVLVPGGNPQSFIQNKDIDRIIQDADKAGLLIGGICGGPAALAKAGILKGRKIAHGFGKELPEFLKEFFSGVTLTEEQFVVDGNIITAKPDAYIDFAVEIGCRLDVVNTINSAQEKEYYRGTLGRKIRPLALALLKNSKDQLLLYKAYDSLKKETFYRPLGGEIGFHESGQVAIKRNISEQTTLNLSVNGLVTTFENIFFYAGNPGHEIVMLFETELTNPKDYDRLEIDIIESGKVIDKAVWRSLEEIKIEGARLYPAGIENALT